MSRLDTFLFLCHCLARDDADEVLLRQIQGNDLPWEQVVEAASHHLVTPALYWSLNRKGLLEELPHEVCSYLETVFALNRERNQKILDQLVDVSDLLNGIGVEAVLLKGAASLATELYGDSGVRFVGDLDLLIPEAALGDCVGALKRHDYTSTYQERYGLKHHHYPPLFREGQVARVELHRMLVVPRYSHLLPVQDVLRNAMLLEQYGVRMRLPSPIHRLQHNIVHSQLQDKQHKAGTVELRQLYELVTLVRLWETMLDWKVIAEPFKVHDQEAAFYAYLGMAADLFGLEVPDETAGIESSEGAIRRLRRNLRHPWLLVAANLGFRLNLLERLRSLADDPSKLGKMADPTWYSAQRKLFVRLWQRRW